LTGLLGDKDWRMRTALVNSLGELRGGAAARSLQEALNDEHWYVRRSAADAMGQLRIGWAVPALAAALDDGHWAVRDSAHKALKAICGRDLGRDPTPWENWWQQQRGTNGGDG
jgi:HEAT repeat protein